MSENNAASKDMPHNSIMVRADEKMRQCAPWLCSHLHGAVHADARREELRVGAEIEAPDHPLRHEVLYDAAPARRVDPVLHMHAPVPAGRDKPAIAAHRDIRDLEPVVRRARKLLEPGASRVEHEELRPQGRDDLRPVLGDPQRVRGVRVEPHSVAPRLRRFAGGEHGQAGQREEGREPAQETASGCRR